MRVLVTGGGGFLGSAICRQLLDRGDEVVAFQRSSNPHLDDLGATILEGDIADAGAVNAAADGIDAIIHTAARAGAWGPYEDYYKPNVTGTGNVIDACRRNGVSKLVFTSSPSIVHDGGDIEGGDESLPYPEHLSAPYPATKALAEQLVMAANGQDLLTVSLRPHLVWGPGDNHLLPRLIEKARGGTLKLPGPDKLIDTVYIDNAANAHLLALNCLESSPGAVAGKTYFISNDEPMAQQEIIGGLLKAAGHDVDIKPIPAAVAIGAGALLETAWRFFRIQSEPPVTRWSAEHLSTAHWFDISAAKRDLGYRAEISIAEGLERLAMHLGVSSRT